MSLLGDQVRKLQERESSKILTHRAVLAVPMFHIKHLSSSKKPAREMGITFLIVNMLDDILKSYTIIQDILQHYWVF